ncbi:MAG: 50S ribosomal protein L29 [Thermonemataceae bacterium]|nr:50S ribosomal protein L29 [Thermonemataceae bacterium]
MSNTKKTKETVKNTDLSALKKEITEQKKELMTLRFKLKLGELSDRSGFKKARKKIARAFTELNKK